jgi:DNA-binding response OmpR family regulator
MRIVIISGGLEDERHLGRVAAQAGLELEFLHWSDELLEVSAVHGGPLEQSSDPRPEGQAALRALIFEGLDQPELAALALREVRTEAYFSEVVALLSVSPGHVGRLDADSGFDDFVLHPYSAEEVLGRILAAERERAGLAGGTALDGLIVDRAGREVLLDGRHVQLTAKEFALLSYLCERQGRVLSREHLLARVWGNRYVGGSRTVDIHVRRLRAKLGPALPLETLRGSGYKLRRRPPSAPPLNGAL